MTETEQVFAEKNLRLVSKFLRINHLPQEDWFDIVILGFLKAVHDFHTGENAQRFAFSTIAFRQMESAVRHEYRYQHATKRPQNVQSLDAVLAECEDQNLTGFSVLEDRRQNVAEKVENIERIHNALDLLDAQSENMKRVVLMHVAGYPHSAISEYCHISRASVSKYVRFFQKRLLEADI